MGFKLKRPPPEEAEMDITPMIDCTFLLLIFFVLTSKMDASKSLNLPKAIHGANAVEQNSVMIIATKGEGEIAKVYLSRTINDSNLAPATAEDQEKAIVSYIIREIRQNPLKKSVVIKADAGLKHREVARIAKAAANVEDVTVEQLYMGILQEK